MARRRNHVPAHESIRALPNLASAHEQKLADFEAPTWFAVFLPCGASEPIIRKLNQAVMFKIHAPRILKRRPAKKTADRALRRLLAVVRGRRPSSTFW
jgi:tripartite-type tricarboxylate transporter receptor subunit TctC